jgi:ubiquinol-cytochrome c reductase cytochrome b subunit
MRLGLSVLVMLMVCSSTAFASPRSQKVRGASVFAGSGCTHCHSIRKEGGHKGPDLSGVGRRLTKVQMRRQITEGSRLMPPFGDTLQETEIADLISYLRSCRDKAKK